MTLTFLISALVVYYAMVLPASRLLKLFERNKAATTRDCPECTMSIPVAATRCPECTAADHSRHRTAPASRTARVTFTTRMSGKLYRAAMRI